MPAAALPPTSPSAIRASAAVALVALLALIALGLAWELWLDRTGQGTLALKVLPLVLPLPGLLQRRLYTYRWTSLLAWWPVAEGLVRGPSGSGLGATLAWAQVTLGVVLFAACVAQVRLRRPAAEPA